mgnify:CR=1 FL=1
MTKRSLGKFHNLNRVQRSLNGLNGIDGTMVKYDNLSELCKAFGADPKVVEDELVKYNARSRKARTLSLINRLNVPAARLKRST